MYTYLNKRGEMVDDLATKGIEFTTAKQIFGQDLKGLMAMVGGNGTVDASKFAGRTVEVSDTVGDYSRLPRNLLPDIKKGNNSYKIKADTSGFEGNGLQHLFDGNAKVNGNGTVKIGGFHYEPGSDFGKVVQGSEVQSTSGNGVYRAKVKIYGRRKNTNGDSTSTFFPKNWSREDVVEGAKSVYKPGNLDLTAQSANSVYVGTYLGVRIVTIVNPRSGKIITSYPEWPQ